MHGWRAAPAADPTDGRVHRESGRGPCHDVTHLAVILQLLADQADARARRAATSVPLLARLGGEALATEMRLRGRDHAAFLAAMGLPGRSSLDSVADRVPAAVDRVGALAVQLGRARADLLDRFAEVVHHRCRSTPTDAATT